MASISLRVDAADAQRALQRLRAEAPAGITRALNRSILGTQTLMARNVASDLRIKVGSVKKQFVLERARPGVELARISAMGKPIPLIAFKPRGPDPSRGKGAGVTARLPGGSVTYPHAFIARMPSGFRGVFARVGKPRLPIKQLYGPSIADVFVVHTPAGLARGEELLLTNLKSEFKFRLGGV